VIDEPKGEAWGGVVAAPVFRRIAEQALPYLRVPTGGPVKVAFSMGSAGNSAGSVLVQEQ